MRRSLIYYWRVNLAVLFAVAVCSAVLTGALLVGDSIRGSLRDLTLDRLGNIDLALVTERFFRADIATDLTSLPEFKDGFRAAVPAIVLHGTALHAQTRARASGVSVLGIDERFIALFREPLTSDAFRPTDGDLTPEGLNLDRRPGQVFPSVVVNASLQRELGVAIGDALLVNFRLGSEIPRDSLLGDRETAAVVGAVRAVVSGIVPDRGIGRFGLSPHQGAPLNAFLSVEDLQDALHQPGRVNALLVSRRTGTAAAPHPLLERVVRLADLGLRLRTLSPQLNPFIEVQSDEFVLRQGLVEKISETARGLGMPVLALQAYLANAMQVGDRLVPYSMVLAIDNPSAPTPFGQLQTPGGTPAPLLEGNEILLNDWTAHDLQAERGDELTMSYYVIGPDESLRTEQRVFEVAGTVAMDGLAIDPELTPDYPGIEGIDDIARWDPPFPVDLSVIRDRDEAYWDRYRGVPKAFVSEATGRALWTTRYGATTSMRVSIAPDTGIDAARTRFANALRSQLDIQQHGFRFLDVKRIGLDASRGATDFGGLFIGFSFFLILSALMIVSLLFTLGIEQRAGQLGTLLAIGYPLRRIRRQVMAEGLIIAAAGTALGTAGAVLYGKLLVLGLRTLWLPAVGSPLLFLHVSAATLALGGSIALLVVGVSIGWSVRRIQRVPVPRLLAGSFGSMEASAPLRLRRSRAVGIACGFLAIAQLAYGLAAGRATSPALAFGIGAALLVGGLAGFSFWCRRSRGRLNASGWRAATAMAVRNSGWNPGRSILSVALVASACFVIVTVAGNTRDPETETEAVLHGAGGYTLLASSDIPLHQDLNDAGGRFELGFPQSAIEQLEGVSITHLRLLPGDDASCLNLYQPQRPRVLGVPSLQIDRGGFLFAATATVGPDFENNPWKLLERDLGPGVIPAIGDANSTQWILHLGLGDELVMTNEAGDPIRLRIVGTIQDSIFQSELLISEDNFLRHFPSRSGFSYFLIDVPAERVSAVGAYLEEVLSPFGFDTTPTATKIAGYLAVQNTYLSTFLMLGGLGLLLGTIGLGIILVRNVIERRGELATLRAFGFRRSFLGRMVLMENAFLLATGVTIGALAALIAISPRFLLGSLTLPWTTLGLALAAVLAVGMLASGVAVFGALRIPLLPALKAER